jgi:GntR family transcriptional regulator
MARQARKTPKYYRIMQRIVDDIRAGRLQPGQAAPSENEIIDKHGVSNTTARKVHLELERGGWVARVKGKGTYVRHERVGRSVDRILAFTRNMTLAGRTPSTKLISARLSDAGMSATISGRRYRLEGPVCVVKRLRLADGVPMMVETRYVSGRLCPGLHKKDLTGSLYRIYEEDYGLQLSQIYQDLSAEIVNAAEMGFEGVEGEIPAMVVDGVTTIGKEIILEVEKSTYRGDMYRFSVRATR